MERRNSLIKVWEAKGSSKKPVVESLLLGWCLFNLLRRHPYLAKMTCAEEYAFCTDGNLMGIGTDANLQMKSHNLHLD